MKQHIYHLQNFIGTPAAHKENVLVALCMLAATLGYEYISFLILPDFSLNWFELIGTWSGLTTVWLCRTQNILCWPWGIVSAACLGYFFATIGLPGQQWLNWGYFLIIQVWSWPYWAFGGKQATELPVTTLSRRGRIYMAVSLILGSVLVYSLISYISPGSQYPIVDAIVVASSVVAQYLLGQKKLESWFLWLGPVNILSIVLFFLAGAYIVMALYVAFFIHAVFAIKAWRTELRLLAQ